MPRKLACFLSHGLLVGQPVDDLAAFLNQNTPNGVHFNTVGGADPQPYQPQITQQVIDAKNGGADIIFGGHSMGADLAFYLADQLKSLNIRAPLFISIDSTDWGSNAPGTQPWSLVSATPGTWLVPDNIDRWLHFSQPDPPGGGQAKLAPNNATTNLTTATEPGGHLAIPTLPQVEQAILSAVLDVWNAPVA
jgi:hypothetical protein